MPATLTARFSVAAGLAVVAPRLHPVATAAHRTPAGRPGTGVVKEKQPALFVGAGPQPTRHVSLHLTPGQHDASRPVGLERPGDAVGPDVGHATNVAEIATEHGRVGLHSNDALQVIAHRPHGTDILSSARAVRAK